MAATGDRLAELLPVLLREEANPTAAGYAVRELESHEIADVAFALGAEFLVFVKVGLVHGVSFRALAGGGVLGFVLELKQAGCQVPLEFLKLF